MTVLSKKDQSKDALFNELEKVNEELNSLRKKMREVQTFSDAANYEKRKWLTCYKRLTEILEVPTLPVDDICSQIVHIIPDSMRFPEVAQAAITIDGKVYKTAGYKHCKRSLFQKMEVEGEEIGQMEVCYPDDIPYEPEMLFLPEESDWLKTIAQRLTGYIERKEGWTALKETENKYQSLIENINDVIFELDIHGIIRYISPSIHKVLGFRAKDVIGRNFSDFVGENKDFLQQRFRSLSDSKQITNEYKIQGLDGQSRWIRLSTKAIIEKGVFKGGTGTLIDVTEKKSIELELQKSESLYRSILNASPDTIAIIDLQGRILFVSPMALKMFGYNNVDAFLNKPLVDFIIPEEHLKTRNAITQLFRGKYTGATEYTAIKSDGTLIFTDVKGELLRNVEGNPTSVIFVIRDITDRKYAEDKLRKSEEIYRHLVETISDVIYEIQLDGKIKYVSPVIENMLGYKPEELIGQNFLDYVYPPDRSILSDRMMLVQQQVYPSIEYRYLNKLGRICWVRSSTTDIMENGEIIGKTGTLIDITEKKEAEEKIIRQNERMSAILTAMPDLIFIMDADGTYLEYFAYNTAELLAPKEKLVGMNMREIFDKKTFNLHIGKIKECIRKKQLISYDYSVVEKSGLHYYEVRLLSLSENKVLRFVRDITDRKNSEKKIYELNANLEQKIHERTAQLAETNQDLLKEIENRKQAEEELKGARLEAERANQAKSEFLSRMSHELRTPMNSILGFAQLLDMGDLNPQQKKGVKHILRSGKILLDLINEVLDISRIESGRLSLSLEPVQIKGLVYEMIDIVYPMANNRGVKIEMIDSYSSQLFVKSDRQRLKQVLLNLLTNAIKYNKPNGSVTIKTDLIPFKEAGESWIKISITDTGPGILPKDFSRLFKPFERIGAERTETEGTGLGLAVVKKLIEAMGGSLGVESRKGAGSTFWFELPQSESPLESLHTDPLTSFEPKGNKSGKILYIEDNVSNIELVEQILAERRSQIQLLTSMDGKQAVNLAKKISPDLILLDLNLPDIHGSEVLANLLSDKRTKEIPVVIVSADVVQIQLDRLIKAGAKEFLTKPLDLVRLLQVIDEYIKG